MSLTRSQRISVTHRILHQSWTRKQFAHMIGILPQTLQYKASMQSCCVQFLITTGVDIMSRAYDCIFRMLSKITTRRKWTREKPTARVNTSVSEFFWTFPFLFVYSFFHLLEFTCRQMLLMPMFKKKYRRENILSIFFFSFKLGAKNSTILI